jgi:hypothetical protein
MSDTFGGGVITVTIFLLTVITDGHALEAAAKSSIANWLQAAFVQIRYLAQHIVIDFGLYTYDATDSCVLSIRRPIRYLVTVH